MKINVEIDCTPEEARRFLGLPDFAPVHEKYIANVLDYMDKGIAADAVEEVIKGWAPMGEAGMNFWRQMFDQSGKNKA